MKDDELSDQRNFILAQKAPDASKALEAYEEMTRGIEDAMSMPENIEAIEQHPRRDWLRAT